MAKPCPANLTPGTFPGYDCGGGGGLTAAQLNQAKHLISQAKIRLEAAEQECVVLVSQLKDGVVTVAQLKGSKPGKQYRLDKASCEAALPPVPSDSPPA